MAETTELVDRLERGLARPLDGEHSLDAACRVCVEVLAADGGSIAFGPSVAGSVRTATDLTAALLAEVQERLGEGPLYDAFGTALPAEVEFDGSGEQDAERWPVFWSVARATIGDDLHLYTFPLHVGGWTYGVLSLWSRRNELAAAITEVQSAVDEIGVTILRHSRESSDDAGARGRDDRARVHQATGMLVAQLGIPVVDALAVLRARAFTQGVPVADVAADVVARRATFDEGL